MPNGGSDCCGTCWFNRKNEGQKGTDHASADKEPYCEIRGVAIRNPFWTYCANHPHRCPDRDPVPIGPILVYAGDGWTNDREVWKPSPDTEAIRLHLLEMLNTLEETISQVEADWYPIGPPLAATIMWQLGQFREERAVQRLRWIRDNCPAFLAEPAREALQQIRGEHPDDAMSEA